MPDTQVGRWSLTDVPFDVLVLVAKALLPYDLLSLSSTCSTLRRLLRDKGLWLSIATSLSFHRPLPFTASQALASSVETLFRTCLRTERVAKKWSWNKELQPKLGDKHVKIAFTDKRNIPYFTILPGARRIMAFDIKNSLSCWSTDGKLLATYSVKRGARLTRWKPIDESDSQYDPSKGAFHHTVEVMVEHITMREHTTRYEVILLQYDDDGASFTRHEQFRLPNVYEPDSAMSQDELWGALVHFSGDQTERFGIYLVDRNLKKAICIDPGIVPEYPPQALISPKYLVLYWETSQGPRSYAYTMPTLRHILATRGLHCDGDQLHESISVPVQIPPDEKYFASFHTIRRTTADEKSKDNKTSSDASTSTEEGDLVEDSLINNSDWYPIVIPKWTTMKDDLTAHWTRSVMTLSRRPPPNHGMPHAVGPNMFVNQMNGAFQAVPPIPNFPVPNGLNGPAGNAEAGEAAGNLPFALNIPQLVQMAAAQAQAIFGAPLIDPPHPPGGAAANGLQAHAPQAPNAPPPPPPPPPVQDDVDHEGDTDEDMPQLEYTSDDDSMDGDDVAMAGAVVVDEMGDDLPPLLPAINEFPPPDPNAPEPPPPPMPNNMAHFHVHQGRPPARLMTITHHYYSFTDKEPQIKRTLIAEARIRQPRHPPHMGVFGFDVILDGPGAAGMQFLPFGMAGANGAANANAGAGAPAPGAAGDLPGAFAFQMGGLPGWVNGQPQPPPAGNAGGQAGQGPQIGGLGFGPMFMGWGMPAPPGGQAGAGDQPGAAAGGAGAQNGNDAPPPAGAPAVPHFHVAAANLQEQPLGADADFPEDGLMDIAPEELGSGTPVMGYGGRCALWVQEGDGPSSGPSASREGVVKIATFPSHALQDLPSEWDPSQFDSYASLEKVAGNLCTVHIPECVDVENALAFDLDDVRGVVGISNSKGEIWLVDYS